MYKTPRYSKSSFTRNTSTEGEPIEVKIERIISEKVPIKDGAPILYTPRKEGIRPSTNIRTDRFEVAIDASDKISKSYKARREERMKNEETKGDGKPESTQGKGGEAPTGK